MGKYRLNAVLDSSDKANIRSDEVFVKRGKRPLLTTTEKFVLLLIAAEVVVGGILNGSGLM